MDSFIRFIAYFRWEKYLCYDYLRYFTESYFSEDQFYSITKSIFIAIFIFLIIFSFIISLFFRKKKLTAFFVCFTLLSAFVIYQYIPETKVYNIHIGLENPIKIVQLSDMHTNSSIPFTLKTAILKTNSEKPDIVLLTGDYKTNTEDRPLKKELFAELKKIKADKKYAVYGNHDVFDNQEETDRKFSDINIKLMHKKIIPLSDKLYLTGYHYIETENIMPPDIERLKKKKHPTDAEKKILVDYMLSHNEYKSIFEYIDSLPKNRNYIFMYHSPAVLYHHIKNKPITDKNIYFVTGHTHGGQVIPPWLKKEYIAWHLFFLPKLSGLIDLGKTKIYISKGIGTGRLPIRFNAKPEITVYRID